MAQRTIYQCGSVAFQRNSIVIHKAVTASTPVMVKAMVKTSQHRYHVIEADGNFGSVITCSNGRSLLAYEF